MREFIVHLDNRPGRLAQVTETLAQASVNIDALAAHGNGDESVLRLIVDDAASARRALDEAGLLVEEREVLAARLRNTPGALAAVTRRLADAEVNIDALYVLSTSDQAIDVAIAVDEPLEAVPDLPVMGSLTTPSPGAM